MNDSEARAPVLTGGCQCGAVRYALYAVPSGPHICHCRMCQKAFGSFFAPLAEVALADIAWTRTEPKRFASSALVERGFCPECGTPLTFRYIDRDAIDIALGSLDDPSAVVPARQYGVESRVPYFAALHGLPESTTEGDVPPERMAGLKSFQHPDRDTAD
ncbi:MAG: GFA family protein [Alphaproteobacteria bacterium]